METEQEVRRIPYRHRIRARRRYTRVSSGIEERSSALGLVLSVVAAGVAVVFITLWAADRLDRVDQSWHDPWVYGQSR